MAQIKQSCSVTNGSQAVTTAGDLTQRIKKNNIFMVEGELVPYTIAADSTYDGATGKTTVTLTGAYQGTTNTSASGVFAVDATYPDMIPTIAQGDVGTAAIFTQAMYHIQDMVTSVSPGGLLQYSQYWTDVNAWHADVNTWHTDVATWYGDIGNWHTDVDGWHTDTLAAKTLAQNWASQATGTVDGTSYSAKYYAGQASTSATNASTSATNADASATLAQNFATSTNNTFTGSGGMYGALKYATDASTSATLASNWATSLTNTFTGAGGLYGARKYANDASASATSAQNWASQLTTTVDGTSYSAKQYALNASSSATTAQNWATSTTIVSGGFYGAYKYATDASSSASGASTSATNASTSATLAQNFATATNNTFTGSGGFYGAYKYATDAATSATNAGTSATLAQNWATKASGEVVTGQGYSAYYWAQQAATSASQASAGQIQSDWNQTDNTQKSYIANKPNLNANEPINSSRDFVDGTLIVTDLPYVDSQHPWLLTITGNSYGSGIPFDIKAQGYPYNGGMFNLGALSNGAGITGMVVFSNASGNICFWWPRQSYWQGFRVHVGEVQNDSVPYNHVTGISNSVMPTTGVTKTVAITFKQSAFAGYNTDITSLANVATISNNGSAIGINGAAAAGGSILQISNGGLNANVGVGSNAAGSNKALWVTKDGGATYNGFAWQYNADGGASLFVGNTSSAWVERMRYADSGGFGFYHDVGTTGNITVDHTAGERHIQFSSSTFNGGFYCRPSDNVIGLYDWTNGRGVWAYTPATNRFDIGATNTYTGTLNVNSNIFGTSAARSFSLRADTGALNFKGDTGGWAMGMTVQGSSGTQYGGFWANGNADTCSAYSIGDAYNSGLLTVDRASGSTILGSPATDSTAARLQVAGQINVRGSDSGTILSTLNTTASSAAQLTVKHNLGAVDITNARGQINLNGASGTVGVNVVSNLTTTTQDTRTINFNRSVNTGSGIKWYNGTYTAWVDYMGVAGSAGQGPSGTLTPPSGTLVTTWGRRSFIENSNGFGWTFESGNASSTTPAIVAEISSNTGSFRCLGDLTNGGNHYCGGVSLLNGATGTYNGNGSAVTINYTGSGTQYGITMKPATATSNTNTINFLTSGSTYSSATSMASIQHMANDAGINLTGNWYKDGNALVHWGQANVTGGFAALSGYNLQLKNTAGTVQSQITTSATAARTWTMPDKDGTVAMTSDITSGLVPLGKLSLAGNTYVDFLNTFSDTYDKYIIEIENVMPSAVGNLLMRLSTNGTSADAGGSYSSMMAPNGATTSFLQTSFTLANSMDAGAGTSYAGSTFTIEVCNARLVTSSPRVVSTRGAFMTSSAALQSVDYISGYFGSTSPLTGFRLLWSGSQTFSKGMVRVYGVLNN